MEHNALPLHHFAVGIKKDLKKSLTKGIIFGNFGAYNTGDEAILAGQLEELQKLPGTSVTVVSLDKVKTKRQHGVKSISLFSLLSIIKTIWTSDYILFGGGGLLCKNDSGIKGILFQLYTVLFFLYLPLLLNKKLYVTGIGFYKNTNKVISKLAITALKSASSLGVRDNSTYANLKSNGLKPTLYKDNSFLMELSVSKEKYTLSNMTKMYTVGLMLNKPQKEAEGESLAKEISLFLVNQRQTTHFVFYTLDYHPSYENDKLFAKNILKRVSNFPTISYEFYPAKKHPREIFASFSNLDFAITSRLHGSIFAFRSEITFFAISYDLKCESFLKSINHEYTYPQNVKEKDITENFQTAKKITHKLTSDNLGAFLGGMII